ncbi:MAG: carbamoyltransferase HypF [Planctomycetota bacterium]|nr:carbamoyltransferase HypF [Planctomycetota bacterium]
MNAADSLTGTSSSPSPAVRRLAITVRGVVQGVGFRPFVYKTAHEESLSGWVLNEADAVQIEVQGTAAALDRFLAALRSRYPPQARLDSLDVQPIGLPPEGIGASDFQIRSSTGQSTPRPTIPADLATCAECQQEIRDPQARRYRYPFTNCTNCGPRWSIIRALPYDRLRTSMQWFAMCDACRAEYDDPGDRRFHAQPIACPLCGPQVALLDHHGTRLADAETALEQAAQAVREGKILALQGLGGFQLIVDATSSSAVERLRRRKQRPHKPFAVMLATLDDVRRQAVVTADEAVALASHQAPIVLVRRRETAQIVVEVAPQNPCLGLLLPYSPLHHLLLDRIRRPVVCTSGNLSEEPMAITTEDALARLGRIADLLLTHDRPIVRPVDDSVVRIVHVVASLRDAKPGLGETGLREAGRVQVLRRARGYAPLAIPLGFQAPSILAVGGHLKNAVALSLGAEVVISPHIGDLDTALSVEVHRRTIQDLVEFFAVTPHAVACDLHPDYASTRHAEQLATTWDVPLVRVQHHHAHVAACLAEHALQGPVLGFAWDGTGYGPDATVWGGEVLHCEGAEFQRVAHLRTFPLPGGDRAAREPRRTALGLLFEMLGDAVAPWAERWFAEAELGVLLAALRRPHVFPRTSSMGRLFDAVAAICDLPDRVSFEGQAAMGLEFVADATVREAYPLPLSDTIPASGDWEPMIRAVLEDREQGVGVEVIAARFHNALAALALAVARRCGDPQVALTGGCFQNALLTVRVQERLSADGFRVYIQQQVPPGDGGLALGQVLVAARRLT